MINELIFILQTCTIATASLLALKLSKEALIAFLALLCVLANIFVLKQVTLFGLQVTAADAFSVGTILSLTMLQEYFKKEIAKQAIWICFFCMVFYTITSQIHLMFIPTAQDFSQTHFCSLLQFAPRITLASLATYFLTLNLSNFLYSKIKKIWGAKYLIVRSFLMVAFIQLIDTIFFSILGLWGVVEKIGHVILVSFTIKLVATTLVTPAFLMAKRIKKTNSR